MVRKNLATSLQLAAVLKKAQRCLKLLQNNSRLILTTTPKASSVILVAVCQFVCLPVIIAQHLRNTNQR
jgi:hypothetical protein